MAKELEPKKEPENYGLGSGTEYEVWGLLRKVKLGDVRLC